MSDIGDNAAALFAGVCAWRFVAEVRGDEDDDPPRCPPDVRDACEDETCPWRVKERSIDPYCDDGTDLRDFGDQ